MCFDPTSISGLSHLLNTPKVLLRELPLATRLTETLFEVPGLGMKLRAFCMLGKHSTTELPPQPMRRVSIWFFFIRAFYILVQIVIWLLLFTPLHKSRSGGETTERDGGCSGNTGKLRQILLFFTSRPSPKPTRRSQGFRGIRTYFLLPLDITVYSHIVRSAVSIFFYF